MQLCSACAWNKINKAQEARQPQINGDTIRILAYNAAPVHIGDNVSPELQTACASYTSNACGKYRLRKSRRGVRESPLRIKESILTKGFSVKRKPNARQALFPPAETAVAGAQALAITFLSETALLMETAIVGAS